MKAFFLALFFLSCAALAEKQNIQMAALPALSPDGKKIVFNWNGDLWIVSSQGGNAKQLTNHPADDTSPKFSPDGKSIAFVSSRESYRQVYIMSINGGVPQRIGFHSSGYTLIDWYADGKSLLTKSYRDNHGRKGVRFYQLPVERKRESMLFDAGVGEGSLSPDNNKVLFTRESAELYRKGYSGNQSSQIWLYDNKEEEYTSLLKGIKAYRSPMWDASGKFFYYVSSEKGTFNLWKYNFKSQQKQQLTHYKNDGVILPSISKDGSTIIYRQQFDFHTYDTSTQKSSKLKIWTERDKNSNPYSYRKLSQSTDMSFSSDGLEIAFSAGNDLWVMDTIVKEPVQITKTNAIERDIVFSKDNNSILMVRDEGTSVAIVKIEKVEKKYWWQSNKFKETVLLSGTKNIMQTSLSPNGKILSYVKERGDLYIYDLEKKEEKLIVKSWNQPDYNWSPDSQWLTYAIQDENYNADIWVTPIDGRRPPYNLSRHPDPDYSPSFSADGKIIVFSSKRYGDDYDICYVYLQKDKEDTSSRDRKVEEALKLMQRMRPDKKTPAKAGKAPQEKTLVKKNGTSKPPTKPINKTSAQANKADAKDASKTEKVSEKKELIVEIDFDGISERIHRIKSPGYEYGYFWSPTGSRLGFIGKSATGAQTYTVEFPDKLKPTLLYKGSLSVQHWLAKNDTLLCSFKGVPSTFSRGKLTQYSFSAIHKENKKEMQRMVFRQIWRTMRDKYYDATLNHKDWNKVRETYEEIATNAVDTRIFDRTINMLLGELNGSHLGYRSAAKAPSFDTGLEHTAHLGVKFNSDYNGTGWQIKHVIKGSSASLTKSLLKINEVILSIDGLKIEKSMDETVLLNGPLKRDIRLTVKGTDDKERTVTIRPMSYDAIRKLLYAEWLAYNRKMAHKLSNDKVGYLHVSSMNWEEFQKFKEQVFKEGLNRDALIIDVRDNGGGFTTDHLLTVLCQPRHAICLPRGGNKRGYPFSRQVYSNWFKPVIVLCNQNSYSNAEIFSHAIKTLGRGKVVGVQTAGGVISTGRQNILGRGDLRIPFRGWYNVDSGEDMELQGAMPDITIWPLPGEMESGKDVQLETAVQAVLKEVKESIEKNKLKLKKASERK